MLDKRKSLFVRRFVIAAYVLLACLTGVPSAQADWRKDLGTFRIGISATDTGTLTPTEIKKLESGYSTALGMPAEVKIFRDYPALIDAHASSRIEYAIYSSIAYATAWLLCECIEPLVAPVQTNGATGIRSALVLNSGKAFTRLDLNGMRIGIPEKGSISGFAIPMVEYVIGTRKLSEDDAFILHLSDTSSMISAFSDGKIDGFFGWIYSDGAGSLAVSGLMDTGSVSTISVSGKKTDIKMPWVSGLLRYGPHAIRKNLPPEARDALQSFFSAIGSTDVDLLSQFQPTNIAKFVPATHAEYKLAVVTTKFLATVSK